MEEEPLPETLSESPETNVEQAPQGIRIKIPLHVALSLLEPEELEKLRKYIVFYLTKHPPGKK